MNRRSALQLGSLCRRGHEHENSGQSLRYASGSCVACAKEKFSERYAANADLINARTAASPSRKTTQHADEMRAWRLLNRDRLNQKNREYRQANKPKAAARLREYRKTHREVMRRIESRRKRPPEFRQRFNEYAKAWKRRNPDRVLASHQKRRAMLSRTENPATAQQIREKRESQRGLCSYCCQPLDNNGRGHLEHQVPISRGGSAGIDNVVFACSICNLSKGTLTASEFIMKRAALAVGVCWLDGVRSNVDITNAPASPTGE